MIKCYLIFEVRGNREDSKGSSSRLGTPDSACGVFRTGHAVYCTSEEMAFAERYSLAWNEDAFGHRRVLLCFGLTPGSEPFLAEFHRW